MITLITPYYAYDYGIKPHLERVLRLLRFFLMRTRAKQKNHHYKSVRARVYI